MLIPFWPSDEDFYYKEGNIAGETAVLITPKIGAKWTRDSLIFRSSIWNKASGQLISASFKKFFNWDEQPDLTPSVDFNKSAFTEKVDGSTLIVSQYKGQLITRTRGTFDAHGMDNGSEIDYLIGKYPKAFRPDPNFSFIYEWVSPDNQIVLKYDKPDIYLIGMIDHSHYTYESQYTLDGLADYLGVQRPNSYKFSSPENLFKIVSEFENQEGICVYFNGDQDIRKVKSSKYLALHALKNMMDSDKAIVDLFIEWNYPTYTDFMSELEKQYDYEVAQFVIGQVSRVTEAYKQYKTFYNHLKEFVEERRWMSRKEFALAVFDAYGHTDRAGFAFKILDNRDIEPRLIKKVLLQMMARGK